MRYGKTIKRLAIIAPAVVVAAVAILYLLASWVPGGYQPARLSSQRRVAVANADFPQHIADFGNAAQKNQPFTWTLTVDQLNWYLASMDEIADFFSPGPGKDGQVNEAMARAQLAGPAAAMDDGVLTLMVRQAGRNRIFSADIAFSPAPDGQLTVDLVAFRIGLLPVPRGLVRTRISQLGRMITVRASEQQGTSGKGRRSVAAVSAEDMARLIRQLLGALDGEPVTQELVWPVGKKGVRIERVEIDDGLLRLHVQPIRPEPANQSHGVRL